MAEYVWDDSHLPIVLLRVPATSTVEEAARYYAFCEALYARTRVLTIAYIARVGAPNKESTTYAGDWMKRNLQTLERQVLGTVFVTRSTIFRFVLSGLFLIQRLPFDYEVVGDLGSALAWAEPLLQRAGLALPAGVSEHATQFFAES